MKTVVTLVCMVVSSYCFGQQLVYTAKNPAFGGDPFNYTWLLNSANAQNSFEDPAFNIDELTNLDSFTDNLANRGEGGTPLQPGTTAVGNFELEVIESLQGVIINILDITTGEQSQIILPN